MKIAVSLLVEMEVPTRSNKDRQVAQLARKIEDLGFTVVSSSAGDAIAEAAERVRDAAAQVREIRQKLPS